MNEEKNKIRFSKKIFIIIACFIIFILIQQFYFFLPGLHINRVPTEDMVCRANLKHLGLAFYMYAQNNSNSYPTPDKWCDLIRPYLPRGADDKILRCPAAEEARCHYAMNPDCEPNSPPDTILLFETKNSYLNLFGGTELLSFDNHKEKICNVLFNDGSVEGIKKDEISNLKWNAKEPNE
ncbi:MAG: hypothetical protein JW787_14090 [Sedimentisphaerales bacterium]|nr:hypothetical protein [Sedimentisphaerales bacterium]